MAEDKAAFAPPEGSQRSDIAEESCDNVYGYTKGGQPDFGNPEPYGKEFPGDLEEPQIGKGERNEWGCQGFMVQPLRNGFSMPGTRVYSRRDDYEITEGDNFDPVQAYGPRLKKHRDSGD